MRGLSFDMAALCSDAHRQDPHASGAEPGSETPLETDGYGQHGEARQLSQHVPERARPQPHAGQYAGTVQGVDRGPSTVGTLDIELLRQAADEVRSVASHLAEREPRTARVLGQIAGHLAELADIIEREAM
jgi:hypothetical protein